MFRFERNEIVRFVRRKFGFWTFLLLLLRRCRFEHPPSFTCCLDQIPRSSYYRQRLVSLRYSRFGRWGSRDGRPRRILTDKSDALDRRESSFSTSKIQRWRSSTWVQDFRSGQLSSIQTIRSIPLLLLPCPCHRYERGGLVVLIEWIVSETIARFYPLTGSQDWSSVVDCPGWEDGCRVGNDDRWMTGWE